MPRSADASSSPLHVSPGVRTSHNTLTSHRRARFLRGLSHQGPVSQQASPGQRGARPRRGGGADGLAAPPASLAPACSVFTTQDTAGRRPDVPRHPHSLQHVPLQGLRMATCPARLARGRRCPDGVPWTSPNSRPRMDAVAVPAPLWAGSETPPSPPPPRPSGTRKARQPLRGCWAQPRLSPRAGGRAGCGFQDSDGSSRCEQDGNEDAGLLP